MKKRFVIKQLSSLDKVFLDDAVNEKKEIAGCTALAGERVSYQVLYAAHGAEKVPLRVTVRAHEALTIRLSTVGSVGCALPILPDISGEYFLRTAPGLYPDVLYPLENDAVAACPTLRHSLFVTCALPEELAPGEYPVSLTFTDGEEDVSEEALFSIRVLPAALPPQDLIYSQWFYADCIASIYRCEVFSEEHWRLVEQFIRQAAYSGVNLILTPVFTPPLDTEVGLDRPTVQLVGVSYRGGAYRFDFTLLARWISLCRKYGIEQFEISHLFTQWGTNRTPKIMVETEHGMEKRFGWHVKATDEAYREFLDSFLPALIDFLKREGAYESAWFHVSDEPHYDRDLDCYRRQYEMLNRWVPAEKITDAMSDYEFCEQGLSENPIVLVSKVDRFFARGKKDIWTYYCCVPADGRYSNRFIAQPSSANRVLGFLLFLYDIRGFLHWGYNFYYSELSRRKINPFLETDKEEATPSGNTFSVYPGEDGPLESLRSVVFYEALQDYRACRLLEGLIGKEETDRIICADGPMRMDVFPRDADGVLAIRERVNRKLAEVLANR